MHRHLRSTGLSKLASDTLSETLPDSQAISEIQSVVDIVNAACPQYQDMGNGVTLLSVQYLGDKVVYDYKINKIADDIETYLDDLKKSMLYLCKAEVQASSTSKAFFENLVKTGTRIVYYYHNDSGKSFSVEISADDLREVVGVQ